VADKERMKPVGVGVSSFLQGFDTVGWLRLAHEDVCHLFPKDLSGTDELMKEEIRQEWLTRVHLGNGREN